MAALNPGTQAPTFTLPSTAGKQVDLKATASSQQLTVLAFFKVSCPVCQFAFPYLERLYRNYPSVPLWGVSQDDKDATDAFARMYGTTFAMVLDEALQATVHYDLTNVPTIFAIGSDGKIVQTIVGFAKKDFEVLNERMAKAAGVPVKSLFTDADEVPELRPG
jgi:peroxiredoxin